LFCATNELSPFYVLQMSLQLENWCTN